MAPNQRHRLGIGKVRPFGIGNLASVDRLPSFVVDQGERPHERFQVSHPDKVDVGDHAASCDSDGNQCMRRSWREEELSHAIQKSFLFEFSLCVG